MAINGDFKALRQMRADVARMATSDWRRGLAANLGDEALNQVAEGFARERDPYGRKWPASLRVAEGGGQTLSLTAQLRRSFARRGVDARPDGFTIGSNVIYAITHQKGATIKPRHGEHLRFRNREGGLVKVKQVRIPQRQMVPEGDLGPIWGPAMEDAATAYIQETIG